MQSKTFGAPTVSGNISNPVLKTIATDEIIGAGAAGMGYIGGTIDSAIGFSDAGLLTGLGADIGENLGNDFANRITEDTNTNPDRIRYFGDPVSMFGFNATTVLPTFKQRWRNSARSYNNLEIADKVEFHDIPKNPLTPPPDDSLAEVITE